MRMPTQNLFTSCGIVLPEQRRPRPAPKPPRRVKSAPARDEGVAEADGPDLPKTA